MPLQQFDERILVSNGLTLDDTTTTATWHPILTSYPTGDWRADVLQATNTDTIDHNLLISPDNGSPFVAGQVLLPAGAGTGAVPPVDILAAILPAAYHYLLIPNADSIAVQLLEAISSGKMVHLFVMGGVV